MADPLVCAVMLTRNRPQMAARAVDAFKRQTYGNRHLLIWDNGKLNRDFQDDAEQITHIPADAYRNIKIGALRNEANKSAIELYKAQIIVHWDDDDLSHPDRLTEQVRLLMETGKQAVGYRQVLFWRKPVMIDDRAMPESYGEAWIYADPRPGYSIGSSLCYWAQAWKRRPFNPKLPSAMQSTGEDNEWARDIDLIGVSAQHPTGWRLICSIHGGNSADYGAVLGNSPSWMRTPRWDEEARERMKL